MSGGLLHIPLTVRTAVFGGIGSGATHSQTLEAWLAHVPGLKVVVPSTPADAKGLLTTCIFDDDPCVFIENVALYGTTGPVPEGDAPRPPRRGRRASGTASDVTVVTYGRTVRDALAAAERAGRRGHRRRGGGPPEPGPARHRHRPGSVGRTRRAVVAHHATRFAGFGAEVASLINEELFGELDAPVSRIGAGSPRSAPPPRWRPR